MVDKNKKWYQTGEFEDGYQFGDVFKTVKNAVKTNIKELKTSKGSSKISQNKKEAQTTKTNNSKAFLTKVENGRFKIDPAVRLYGFENEVERQNYIKENPNLYAVMGGYKYEPMMKFNYEDKKIIDNAIKKDRDLKQDNSIEKFENLEQKMLIDSAKKKSKLGKPLTVQEYSTVNETKTLLPEKIIEPKNKSQALNLVRQSMNEQRNKKYEALAYNDDYEFSVEKAQNTDIEKLNIRDKELYKSIKSGKDVYKYMTDEEKGRYYYLASKEDDEEIRKYILHIEPYLENRKAYDVAKDVKLKKVENFGDILINLKKINKATQYAITSGFSGKLTSIARGTVMSSWDNGIINAADPMMNLLDATYQEKLFSSVKENIKDDGFLYNIWIDGVNNFSSQIPDMIMGFGTGQIGYSSMMSMGILGNSMSQAVNDGYDVYKGVAFGGAQIAMELLPDLLTGTGMASFFDDGTTDYIKKTVKWCNDVFENPKIAKTISKISIATANNNAEGKQEFYQRMLEPVIRNIIYGEANKIDEQTFKDALYGYLVGFISTAPMSLTNANAEYKNLNVENIGEILNNDRTINIILDFARTTDVYSEEYNEVKRKFETGNVEAIDDKVLGTLWLQAKEEYTNPSESRLREIGKKAVENLVKNANQYDIQQARKKTNTVCELISNRAVELGSDKQTANKIANNISGRVMVDEGILNSDIAQQIISELKQDENSRPDWVEKVSNEISKNNILYKSYANRNIDEKAFIEGLWDDGRNTEYNESAENVENSKLESVENIEENGIIKEKIDNYTGVLGEYTDEIVWQRRKVPVRKDGKGYRGKRTTQHDQRVNNYELKLNPDGESYFLIHPDGKPVQFENRKNGIVQDCKLVMEKNSIYYVKEKPAFLNENILKQARRQVEAANVVGYKVEWLISDQKAVDQMRQLLNENNLDIIVTYYPE